MIRLSEIEKTLKDQWNLLIEINISLENAIRLTKTIYSNEDKIKNSGFFNLYFYQQKFILAIKLCIILEDKKNQKLNTNKILRRLESENYDNALQEKIETSKFISEPKRGEFLKVVQELEDLIVTNRDLILKISKVRDENYSHLDPKRDNLGPTLNDYKTASELASTIYNRLSLIIKGSTTKFDKTTSWQIDPLIKTLTDKYNERVTELEKKRKNASR